jgi:sugar phosphate permease
VSGSYRWTILAVGVASQTAVSALRQGLPALGPALRGELGLSLTQLGLVFASVSAGIVLTMVAWGALADRIGERPVLAAGLSGCAGALVGAALAPGYATLLAALLVAGAFGASAIGASGRAVMNWFARAERGMALGLRQTGVPLGGALGALVLPALVAVWDLRAALLALALACSLAAAAAWRWMREAPPPPKDRFRVPAPPPTRDRRLWRLAIGSALLVMAQGAMLGFVVVFLHDERGWSAAAAAGVLAGLQAGGALARVAAGRWSDRIEERVAPLRRLCLAAAALLVATAAVAALEAPTAVLLPVLGAAGVLASSWNALSFTAAAELSGRERAGTAIGVQNTVLNAAGALAPVAFAVLVVATSWPAAWALLAVSQVAGVAVLAPLVAEERGRRAARWERLRARSQRPQHGSCKASGEMTASAPTRGAR